MKTNRVSKRIVLAALLACSATLAAEGLPLIDFAAQGVDARLQANAPDNGECKFAISAREGKSGLDVTCTPGQNGYPGVRIKPDGAVWDLSTYGGVEADLVNTGEEPVTVSLRVDNEGDWQKQPWSCEMTTLQPGKSATAKVVFGYSWGKAGYKLDPAKVSAILLFTGKPKAKFAFRVDAVRAVGKPTDKPPGYVDRVKPKDGALVDFADAKAESLIEVRGATATLAGEGAARHAKITFTPNPKEKFPGAFFKAPAAVIWDLSDKIQVEFALSNPGTQPVKVFCRVDNKNADGKNNCAIANETIEAGAKKTVIVSFLAPTVWNPKDKASGAHASSADVVGALVFAEQPAAEAAVCLHSIKAVLPPAPEMPEWLGQKPPVPGEWVRTFNDDFDGEAIDLTKWSYYGPNYWDQKTRWSKDNVIVGGGMVKLRYEKKTGPHNDDPKEKTKDYTCGFLESYGKWTQKYGYVEARMKLPTAPGLWPAFWMMPDRGEAAGPQWKRQNTADGGMEFDIMEHLTRWGPYRYNIAMHWDGYQKDHKSVGTDRIYVQADKDGFITCGVLWSPGSLVYYCNGKEVCRWEDARVSSVAADMMFTVPQGGWDNSPVDDSKWPADFIIDYVRVWQLKERMDAK